ncbi:MAG: YHS domain-containing protein [Candidatus Saccharicenans sp.]|nr:YHS domain-containing protein [Candidatus Saccharicenans sp.]
MIIRVIILVLLLYLIFLVVRFFQSLGQSSRPPRSKSEALPKKTMVKDEVCNTYIAEDEAIKEIQNGRVYYFCSQECRQKFLSARKKPPNSASVS